MDRRQVCAQVLHSSLLPQAIGFLYPCIKDTHLVTYRHKRQIFTATSDWKEATAILPPQAIRPWNAAPATQKQQSPAAVKKITCGSQNERKNERFYCHKRLGHLTATSEVQAIPWMISWCLKDPTAKLQESQESRIFIESLDISRSKINFCGLSRDYSRERLSAGFFQ